ncbi:hypothetical protein AB0J86_19580 [Micromonospora sp. NPDC049559]|uniref:hypothetical protein n=1 Tax=Micromonospora sp. NPDC049559 TaxID=3155923 RepID=UPI0034492996
MGSQAVRVDRADVRETDRDLTLILSTGGVHVVLIRQRYDGLVDEVINNAGVAATWAVSSWTLFGQELSLEYGRQAAATLGFPREQVLRLDLPRDVLAQVRDSLLEILQTACFAVDTPDGRITG